MPTYLKLIQRPLVLAAQSLCAAAILLPFAPAALAAPDAETAALIADLKQRLAALEAAQGAAPAAAPAPAAVAAKPAELKLGDTKFTWGGYVKLDALYSRFSEGEVAQGAGRDFYLPNSILVGNGSGKSHSTLDVHAKETRLYLKTETTLGEHKLGSHVEFDFITSQGAGNERVTNAYAPALRRAFVTYDNWLLGQEWSTFQSLASLPEALDFVTFPSEGTVFSRQAQVRYTRGGLMLALENPETTYLAAAFNPSASGITGSPTFVDAGDSRLPDVVARYNFKFGKANEVSLSGLLRQLNVSNAPAASDTSIGGGVSLAGRLAVGATDDVKFQFTVGEGIGRYIALATAPDAVLSSGKLDTVGIVAGYVAYKHEWVPGLRSSIAYSRFSADNNPATSGGGVTKTVQSGSVNLLYSPVPKLTFGVEYRHAQREIESGADGSLDRLQFSSKYAF